MTKINHSVSTHLMFFGAASEAMELYQSEFDEFKTSYRTVLRKG